MSQIRWPSRNHSTRSRSALLPPSAYDPGPSERSRSPKQLTTARSSPNATVCFARARSEEHTSELQSLMRISYAVFCLKKKTKHTNILQHNDTISTNKHTHP